jgi:hypothetical protein
MFKRNIAILCSEFWRKYALQIIIIIDREMKVKLLSDCQLYKKDVAPCSCPVKRWHSKASWWVITASSSLRLHLAVTADPQCDIYYYNSLTRTAHDGGDIAVIDIRPRRCVCLHSNLTAKSCLLFAVHAKYDLSQNMKSVSFLIPSSTMQQEET